MGARSGRPVWQRTGRTQLWQTLTPTKVGSAEHARFSSAAGFLTSWLGTLSCYSPIFWSCLFVHPSEVTPQSSESIFWALNFFQHDRATAGIRPRKEWERAADVLNSRHAKVACLISGSYVVTVLSRVDLSSDAGPLALSSDSTLVLERGGDVPESLFSL